MLVSFFNVITLIKLGLGLSVIFLVLIYFCFQKQINQRKEAEHNLRQQTERERLVNQIAHHIRESLNLEEVLVTTVADVKEFLQVDRVLIYRIWGDGTGSVITETVSSEYPTILGKTFPEEVFPLEYHEVYSKGKIGTITDIDQENSSDCLANFLKQFGVKAKLVVPILQQIRDNYEPCNSPHLWGLLIAHQCSNPRQWQDWERELMKQLATQVAIAIQQSELYEKLQELNAELENRVQQRTKELARINDFLRAEIRERRRTEAILRHTNHTLQSLIVASPRAIFTVDLEDKIKMWNPAAERIFGWTEREVMNKDNPIIPEEIKKEYQQIKDSIVQGITPPSLEFSCHKKDGLLIDIVFSVAPLQDLESKINGMVAVVADITERKRLKEVHLALEREKEISTLKSRFFSMASHEFRTPLSTALAAAQILEQSPNIINDPEKRLRNLRRIQDSVKDMVQLLDDILTINRAEAGKLEFNPKLLNVEKFCRQFVEEMRLSAGSNHELIFLYEGNSNQAYLDEKLMRSILANLLSNAIKYSPEGGQIKIKLEFNLEELQLEITDQGIGISAEDKKELFEPFHRGKNVRNISGTGLGLIVTKKCVDLHSGTIKIESQLGLGTTITVTIPI